jgi:hypothetical protein
MSFDLQSMLESKRALRRRLSALPVTEKLSLLDALRERAVAIRSATVTEPRTVQEKPEGYGGRKGRKR